MLLRRSAGGSDDAAVLALLNDETSLEPRRGEFDADARLLELEGDGIAGEVIFLKWRLLVQV